MAIFLTIAFYESLNEAIRITAVLVVPSPFPVYMNFLFFRHLFEGGKTVRYVFALVLLILLSGLMIEVFFNSLFPEPDSHISGLFLAFFLIVFSSTIRFLSERLRTGPGTITPPAPKENPYLFYREERVDHRLEISRIRYCRAVGNFVEIHSDNGKVLIPGTLKNLESRLPGERFMRIHRSYVVNLDRIDNVEEGFVRISGVLIPVGRSFHQGFSQWIEKHRI